MKKQTMVYLSDSDRRIVSEYRIYNPEFELSAFVRNCIKEKLSSASILAEEKARLLETIKLIDQRIIEKQNDEKVRFETMRSRDVNMNEQIVWLERIKECRRDYPNWEQYTKEQKLLLLDKKYDTIAPAIIF